MSCDLTNRLYAELNQHHTIPQWLFRVITGVPSKSNMQNTVTHGAQSKFIFEWFNINCYGYCTLHFRICLYPTPSIPNLCTWRLSVYWVSFKKLKALPVKIATFMMKDLTAFNIKWGQHRATFFYLFFFNSELVLNAEYNSCPRQGPSWMLQHIFYG